MFCGTLSAFGGLLLQQTSLSPRLMRLLAFQPGIVKHSAQNDKTACNLQNAWNFAKKKYGEQGSNHRLAQLRGRDKGGGEKFQTPAENAVSQNCGKYS